MEHHHTTLALTYARSLLELADDRGEIEPVANDVDALRQVLDENPGFVAFLRDPGISREERQAVLDKTLSGKASQLVERFLTLMNERNRLGMLGAVVDAFEALLDEKLGKIELDVTVARKLSDTELEHVRKRVSQALKKDAVVHQYVDEEIIGGMILRVGDKVIDASVRRQLAAMKERMLKG
jgi:F-type H+-transporting ATPase subunit delta